MRRFWRRDPTDVILSDTGRQPAEVVAQICAACEKHLGFRPRQVQQEAGERLLSRSIVEMATGEGKTLTTMIPAVIIAAHSPLPVLVATANDYLASRDAKWMRPIFDELGLSVGFVTAESNQQQRRQAYAADVTYGTLREFGFDHLRTLLAARRNDPDAPTADLLSRGRLGALIVDEADSLLIDEARTPMVINEPATDLDPPLQECFRWSAKVASQFEKQSDYVRIDEEGAVALTDSGRRRFLTHPMPDLMRTLTTTQIVHGLERAIWVNEMLHRDHHYVTHRQAVELVDEFTGRLSENRSLGGGLHQAIEAREGLPLTALSEPVAQMTVQDFVGKFKHLCGMTATAWEDRRELEDVYDLQVHGVPPYRPVRRQTLPTVACANEQEKWEQIANQIRELVAQRRPVLVGTRTVAKSERLSAVLAAHDIEHVVLNARFPEQESATIAKAGRAGNVTVATNMAGRGTDIALDQTAAAAGGLHVIVSEAHAAARIDRQLVGRAARQGDPGSENRYVALDDEILLQAFGPAKVAKLAVELSDVTNDQQQAARLIALTKRAQRRVTIEHRSQRQQLTRHQNRLAEALETLGLDPYLDPIPDAE